MKSINEAKGGDEIPARDHHLSLAHAADVDTELLTLAAQGKLRLGEGTLDRSFWKLPAPRVPTVTLRRALEQERGND